MARFRAIGSPVGLRIGRESPSENLLEIPGAIPSVHYLLYASFQPFGLGNDNSDKKRQWTSLEIVRDSP